MNGISYEGSENESADKKIPPLVPVLGSKCNVS